MWKNCLRRTQRRFTSSKPPTELTVDELREIRQGWRTLSEEDRALREWSSGNPFYTPSAEGCESFAEYEARYNRVFISDPSRRLLEREEREQLLELRMRRIQREAFDRLAEHKEREKRDEDGKPPEW
eukprot:Hpha_TRINITY_DN673_c0_g1::TRINITY_DN673_c0_g1_i1::g.21245::m.21245